ncbi:MAG: hypothetical protein JWL77_3572 [Chthonomonadaceae bacterium]|nr:hypothetical protein [Chthonomonadaceae bacterium]
MKPTTPIPTLGRILTTLGKLIVVFSPILYCLIAIPLAARNASVGKSGLYFSADYLHINGMTHPGATLLWWVLISLGGYAIVLLGKKMQAAGERPALKEKRILCLVLLGMAILGGLLWHINR